MEEISSSKTYSLTSSSLNSWSYIEPSSYQAAALLVLERQWIAHVGKYHGLQQPQILVFDHGPSAYDSTRRFRESGSLDEARSCWPIPAASSLQEIDTKANSLCQSLSFSSDIEPGA